MRLIVAISFLVFLFSPTAFSQRADAYFSPQIEWVTLEQAKLLVPENVIHLKLRRNKSNSIPNEIFQYTNLRSLSIAGMRLTVLPDEIAVFKNLEFLDFSKNKIETLPLSICELSKLEILVANRNPLGYLPFCIGQLSNLIAIDLWDTDVTNLPESLDAVKSLKTIDFQGVNLRIEEQELLQKRFPWVKFRFDKPCNCFK